jgi:hypothetical protein
MLSDEEATLFYWYLRHRKHFSHLTTHSSFVVVCELDQDLVKFYNFYRKNIEYFKLLVQIVGPEIRKKDTNFQKAMTVEYPSLQLSYKQDLLSTA